MEQVFFTREYIRENYVYFIVPGVFHVFPLLPLPRKGKNVALSLHHQRIRGFLRCNRIQRKWKFIVHAAAPEIIFCLFPAVSLPLYLSPSSRSWVKGRGGAPSLISVRRVIIFEGTPRVSRNFFNLKSGNKHGNDIKSCLLIILLPSHEI